MTRKPTHVRALSLSLATLVVILSPRLALTADAVGERVGPRAGFAVESEVAGRFDPADRPCPADLNGDGLVGHADVLRILVLWMSSDPSGDVNEDGVVDYDDLLVILRNWGACECSAFSTDRDGDGTPDCDDGCPDDRAKTEPGACGCGVPETEECEGGVTGWTEFTESADTRVIYVSYSEGSDSNNGLSSASPVRTIGKGKSLVRDGYPDWLLLKRGDSWNESYGALAKSGRSSEEPRLISYYGQMSQPRPRLASGDNAFYIWGSSGPSDVAIVGLHLHLASSKSGFETLVAGYHGLLIEECLVEGGRNGILIQPPVGTVAEKITIRRCTIVDNGKSSDALGQGFKSARTTDLLFEENVVDNNGNDLVNEHNLYTSKGARSTIRNNIVTRGSNLGIGFRGPLTDGVLEGNLLVGNQNAIALGGKYEGDITYRAEIIGNVILNSGHDGQHGGISINSVKGLVISNNILANSPEDWALVVFNFGIPSNFSGAGDDRFPEDVLVSNNTVYNYSSTTLEFNEGMPYDDVLITRNIFQQEAEYLVRHRDPIETESIEYADNVYQSDHPSDQWFRNDSDRLSLPNWTAASYETGALNVDTEFVDPHRSLGTYNATLGGAATNEAFLAEARKQERANWREQYTTQAAIAYLRAGFTPTNLDHPHDSYYGAIEY